MRVCLLALCPPQRLLQWRGEGENGKGEALGTTARVSPGALSFPFSPGSARLLYVHLSSFSSPYEKVKEASATSRSLDYANNTCLFSVERDEEEQGISSHLDKANKGKWWK